MDFINLIFTSLLSVTALFLIAKMMGHKQVAQLDFFDYISGITIWLEKQLRAKGYNDPSDIFLAICDKEKVLTVYPVN